MKCSDNDKPEIGDLLISSKLLEGKRFYLICQLNSGNLPISFSWFHFNQLIRSNFSHEIVDSKENSQLIIKEMSLDNNGEYSCKAENSFGSDIKKVDVKLNGMFINMFNLI